MRSNKGFLDQYFHQLTAMFTAELETYHKKRGFENPLPICISI